MIPASMLRTGLMIIGDDCDEPSARMIRVIQKIVSRPDGLHVTAPYLRDDKQLRRYRRSRISLEWATPLSAFGVRAIVHPTLKSVSIEHTGETPTATYPDGVPRRWTTRDEYWVRVDPVVWSWALDVAKHGLIKSPEMA